MLLIQTPSETTISAYIGSCLSDIRHKNLLKQIKDVKTVSSRKRVFYHAGAWLVSSRAGQRPVQARVFIWDRDRVAPGFVADPVSGLS